jgi:Kef-type K+ transport system membrane component KefB
VAPLALLSAETNPALIPLSLLLVFGSAKLMAEIFERLGQPGIVGEIVAGVLIGPYALGWMTPNQTLSVLSDLGVMFLLFRVGLDVKSSELIKVGGTAILVAIAGVVIPFSLGWWIMVLWGAPHLESIFTGAAMVATSVGITAEVLATMGVLHQRASRIILAAAVIDDVLGLLVLAIVTSLARGSINLLELCITAAIALAFTIVVARWGSRTMHRVVPRVHPRLAVPEAEFTLALTLLFGLSLLAVYAGVAAIVGAFLAGMALSEAVERRVIDLTSGVSELLVPFFLGGIGLRLDLTAFSNRRTMLLAGIIVLAAVLAKFVACGLASLGLGRRDAVRVGAGMIPRGEVGMVIAQIGLGMGVIAQGVYGTIVFMSVATTLVAPPLVKWAYRDSPKRSQTGEDPIRTG